MQHCDGCGGTDTEPLVEVHRVYVTRPEAIGGGDAGGGDEQAARYDVVEESEHWCFPCRSMYPHQEAAG